MSAAVPCWAAERPCHRRAGRRWPGLPLGAGRRRGRVPSRVLARLSEKILARLVRGGSRMGAAEPREGTLMRTCARSLWLSLVAVSPLLASAASAVTIDWVTVGDPGNACDPQPQGCFGAVARRLPHREVRGHERAVRRVPEREGGLRPARALQHEHGRRASAASRAAVARAATPTARSRAARTCR